MDTDNIIDKVKEFAIRLSDNKRDLNAVGHKVCGNILNYYNLVLLEQVTFGGMQYIVCASTNLTHLSQSLSF